MPLPAVAGHHDARTALGRAAAAGTLPQSILLHGPAGIGKERLGLWIAQLLVCEAGAAEPCGRCHPCRLAERLQHPDIHWFFPLPRPEGSTPEKMRDRVQDQRAAELDARRADPFRVPVWEKPVAHYLAAVQVLQRLAVSRPSMGARKVFVVGDAEMMVPQEASQEAANAFLKLLEEPPDDTTLVLTTEKPGALLPTILSRVLPVRLGAVPEVEIATLLATSGMAPEEEAKRVAGVAQGSVGRAVRLLPSADGGGSLERARQQARQLLEAALSSSPVPRLAAAHDAAPAGGRAVVLPILDALLGWLRDLSAVAAGAPERAINRDALDFLQRAVSGGALHPSTVSGAVRHVAEARADAEGNVNPQLLLASLLRALQADLAAGRRTA